jgi:hypothetical protein
MGGAGRASRVGARCRHRPLAAATATAARAASSLTSRPAPEVRGLRNSGSASCAGMLASKRPAASKPPAAPNELTESNALVVPRGAFGEAASKRVSTERIITNPERCRSATGTSQLPAFTGALLSGVPDILTRRGSNGHGTCPAPKVLDIRSRTASSADHCLDESPAEAVSRMSSVQSLRSQLGKLRRTPPRDWGAMGLSPQPVRMVQKGGWMTVQVLG